MRVETKQQKYLNEVFGLHDPELAGLRERMRSAEKDYMSISGSEARILQFLIRGFDVRKIVEFGTLFGYSALAMAKALPEDGQLITLEMNPEHHRIAGEAFRASKIGGKIVSLCGAGADLMHTLVDRGPFDMIFVDANKAGYIEYLNWAEKNLRRGGLIVGDNTFLWGNLWGEPTNDAGVEATRVMREFNARLADPNKYNSTLIPTAEGLTVAQKL